MSRRPYLVEAKAEAPAFPNLTASFEKGIPGSKIGIFAPSHAVGSDAITLGISALEKAGFSVDCPDYLDLISPPIVGCLWANSKEERARRIINMLNDPEIEAIWAADGGESAIDVVNLLAQYNKNPDSIKTQIEDSYRARFGEVPADFFTPRCDSFDYSKGALPKRGIPCIGFSDVSGINNFLGQNGIVSPYYANVFTSSGREKVIQHLTGDKKVSKYEGLKLLSAKDFVAKEDEPLQVYATVDGWLGLSCGTDFQFSLTSPTILAIESIESTNMVGHTLQQALEAGALENVRAIVIGRTKDGQVDLEKECPALKEFIKKSGIPVFATDEDLKKGKNSFGHGIGGISEPFANFAKSSLTRQDDGSYVLQIDGKRSLESLNSSYKSQSSSRSSRGESDKLFEPRKTVDEAISIDPETLQPLGEAAGVGVDLSGAKIISANFKEFYCASGTAKQTKAAGKVLLVSADKNTDFLHQALVGNHLSGVSKDAKAIIVATPPYQEKTTLEILQAFTSPGCKYEKGETVDGCETWNLRFPKPPFDTNLKPDLDKINDGSIKYEATTFSDLAGDFVDIKITILDKEKLINRHRKTDIFKEMLADAQKSYFPETPLYFVEDEKLVRTFESGIQVGTLLLEKSQEKPAAEQVTWVEKVQSERKAKGYEKPTISSALKEKDGGEEKALHLASGRRSQETFAEALEKKMAEDQVKRPSR